MDRSFGTALLAVSVFVLVHHRVGALFLVVIKDTIGLVEVIEHVVDFDTKSLGEDLEVLAQTAELVRRLAFVDLG